MRIIESCAACLYDKQRHRMNDPEYLEEIRSIIDNRQEEDTSPYLVYLFNQVYERRFGKRTSYREVKKEYNDFVLSMESDIRRAIETCQDPLGTALAYARIGNYIDFGAMNHVDKDEFLTLLGQIRVSQEDDRTMQSFIRQCGKADRFLLIADNCGEIVLDKLFLEQLRKAFPGLNMTVMVRGGEVLNDVTAEDAQYVGLDQLAQVVSNGKPIAGTIYELLSDEAKCTFDGADVILAKGQGNYESLSQQGRHIFYSFLCKCELFTSRFHVPRLTGVFIEENGQITDSYMSGK